MQSSATLLTQVLIWSWAALAACCPGLAQTLAPTQAPTNYWWSLASSADGTKLVALIGGAPYAQAIYTSADGGVSWASNAVPAVEWWSVASSADGTRLVAAAYGNGGVFTSTDSGANWVSNTVPVTGWFSVACSADGLKLVAVAGGGQILGPIYTSTNAGGNWVSNSVSLDHWECVASSADGSRLLATANNDYYRTSNSGLAWTSNGLPAVTWGAVACSADGMRVVAAVIIGGTHRLLTSTDAGATWLTNSAPISRVNAVAGSADGVNWVAVEPDRIWFSTNCAAMWQSNNINGFWKAVALSADGARWAVANGGPGGIWTAQTTPAPQLKLVPAGGHLRAAWLVPSTTLQLQQNLELPAGNWTDVTNPPTLNLITLQYQLELWPSNRSAFFRLATP